MVRQRKPDVWDVTEGNGGAEHGRCQPLWSAATRHHFSPAGLGQPDLGIDHDARCNGAHAPECVDEKRRQAAAKMTDATHGLTLRLTGTPAIQHDTGGACETLHRSRVRSARPYIG